MARPRKFDHSEIVNKMKLAFWENGFNGVSMDDVGRISNMNRGSIYNAFGDKRALYLEALELFGQQHYGLAVQTIQRSDSAEIAVRSLYDAAFKAMKDDQTRWGCFMCNAAVEVAPVDMEVATIVRKFLSMLSKAFYVALQASAVNATNSMELKHLAEHLTAGYIGFNVMARTGMPTASLRRVAESAVAMARH